MDPIFRTRTVGLVLAGIGCFAAASAPGRAQEAPDDARLDRRLAVEVRLADLGQLTEQLTASLRVPLETDAEMGDRLVTLHAERTSVRSLQDALARTFHANWQVLGEGEAARYRLAESATFDAAVERMGRQRRAAFLNRLLQTEAALSRRRPELLADTLRQDVARRLPYLPQDTLAQITPAFVNQALLASPLRLGLVDELVRTGRVSVPLNRLSPIHQRLLAALFFERYETELTRTQLSSDLVDGRTLPKGVPDPRVLYIPQSRLEYRVLFGDRWTEDLFVARVGAADNWATAVLPASLFGLPDYTGLYPEAVAPSGADPALARNVNVNVDTDTMGWDQALLMVARAGKVNVMSDSYLRPDVFRPEEKGPIIVGTTLGETLDRLADYYGYIWWKDGDWYLFRNRLFGEYERTATPPRVTRTVAANLAADSRLTTHGIAALAGLTHEQLLTMHLFAGAKGKPYVSPTSFDLNEIDLSRTGLLIYAELTEAQRELARGGGLPFVLLSTAQQYLFLNTAYERGVILDPNDRDLWRFRAKETFGREKFPTGWAQVGVIRFVFDYEGMEREAQIGVRVPATEKPAAGDDKK
ncbi:MAG: hypothetical protein ACO1SX_00270 [Actinomycetota bacterium]